MYLGTFLRKFVAKTLKTRPNLVTLHAVRLSTSNTLQLDLPNESEKLALIHFLVALLSV